METEQINYPSSEQLAVINSGEVTILCNAAAGTGKTTTLLARIVRLINEGVHPSKICVVTFTNVAARELRERIGTDIQLGWCGTLHSLMVMLLRRNGSAIGFPKTFTVIDSEQLTSITEEIAFEMRYKGSKSDLVQLVSEWHARPLKPNWSELDVAAAAVHLRLSKEHFVTFDMLLSIGCKLMKAITPEELGMTHLFVDEFQDSSDLDSEIYRSIPVNYRFFVGDWRQSIYGFRRANVNNFLALGIDPRTKVFNLTSNFRSGESIVVAANKLISKSSVPPALNPPMRSVANHQSDVVSLQYDRPGAELAGIASLLDASLKTDSSHSIAVLVRTNALAKEWRDGLAEMGLTVRCDRRPELPEDWRLAKDFVSLLANPESDRLARRAVAHSRGERFASEIVIRALKEMKSINSLMLHIPTNLVGSDIPKLVRRLGASMESVELIARVEASIPNSTPVDLLLALSFLGYPSMDKSEGIFVSTIHGAKGTEWDIVVMPALEEGILPGNQDDISEDRRIAYVGVTRAKKRLILSRSEQRRTRWGRGRRQYDPAIPSRFIEEMLS